MTAPQPWLSRYRPPNYPPPQQMYAASVDDALRRLQHHAESTASETERLHRLLLRHYATPHSNSLRDHGSNR